MDQERREFGPFVLDLRQRVLLRNGVPLQLGLRALALLEALLAAEGRPVSKLALIEEVWAGSEVEDSNLSVQIAALRKLLGTRPDGTDWIVTVQRLGYQLAIPARAGVLEAQQPVPSGGFAVDGRPSIAVLPFDNMSTDPAQSFFSDGLTDEITTALSRLRNVFVIARNTMFTFKGKPINIRSLGNELGVQYIVEGSVRSSGTRIRVSAQLIDAASGSQIWGQRYDHVADDIFVIQDDITSSVVAHIGPELLASEHTRAIRKPTANLNAWECYVRALFLGARLSKTDSAAALSLLNRAVEHDPYYAQALGMIGWLTQFRAIQGWEDIQQAIGVGQSASDRAIAADENEPWGWLGRGSVGISRRSPEIAIPAMERSVELNPNFALAHGLLSLALCFAGRGQEALTRLETAVRLSPQELFQGAFAQQYAFAHFQEGHYEQGLGHALRAHQLRPGHPYPMAIAAACAAHMGRTEEARPLIECLTSAVPNASSGWFETAAPYVLPQDRKRLADGLRLAGLT